MENQYVWHSLKDKKPESFRLLMVVRFIDGIRELRVIEPACYIALTGRFYYRGKVVKHVFAWTEAPTLPETDDKGNIL